MGYNLLAQISAAKLHKLWESTKGIGKKKRKYYEKHRRPRRTTSGYRADVCEALIPSRKQEAQWRQPFTNSAKRGESSSARRYGEFI